MFQKHGRFAQSFRARAGDEFGVQNREHSLAHQPRNPADKVKSERQCWQHSVPRRTPERDGKPAPFDGEHHDEERADDQPRNADHEQRQKTSGVFRPMPFAHCGDETERKAEAQRETKRQRAQRQRGRQPLGDDVIDRVIAIAHGRAEISSDQTTVHATPVSFRRPLPEQSQIAQVLFPDRLVQMKLRFQSAFDLGGGRGAFFVERPARRQVHQAKGQKTDDQHQGDGEHQAFEEIHWSGQWFVVRCPL